MRRLDPSDINVLSKHVIGGRGRNHAIVSEPGFYEIAPPSGKSAAAAAAAANRDTMIRDRAQEIATLATTTRGTV